MITPSITLNEHMARLKKTWHKMDAIYSDYAKKAGVNFSTLLVLECLGEASKTYTQKELCDYLEIPKQMMNGIIKNLWQKGHVILKEASDRRNKEIILTPSGAEYVASILEPLAEAERSSWENFSPQELAKLIESMDKYTTALKQQLS